MNLDVVASTRVNTDQKKESITNSNILASPSITHISNSAQTPLKTKNNRLTHSQSNRELLLRRYEVSSDGACFFRAHLALSEQDETWLNQQSLESVYQWIRANQNQIQGAISSALLSELTDVYSDNETDPLLAETESAGNEQNSARATNEALRHAVERSQIRELLESNFAEEFLTHAMQNDHFHLWKADFLHDFLRTHYLIELPLDWCDEFLDRVFTLMGAQFNVATNPNSTGYLIRDGFHFSLMAPRDFFGPSSPQDEGLTAHPPRLVSHPVTYSTDWRRFEVDAPEASSLIRCWLSLTTDQIKWMSARASSPSEIGAALKKSPYFLKKLVTGLSASFAAHFEQNQHVSQSVRLAQSAFLAEDNLQRLARLIRRHFFTEGRFDFATILLSLHQENALGRGLFNLTCPSDFLALGALVEHQLINAFGLPVYELDELANAARESGEYLVHDNGRYSFVGLNAHFGHRFYPRDPQIYYQDLLTNPDRDNCGAYLQRQWGSQLSADETARLDREEERQSASSGRFVVDENGRVFYQSSAWDESRASFFDPSEGVPRADFNEVRRRDGLFSRADALTAGAELLANGLNTVNQSMATEFGFNLNPHQKARPKNKTQKPPFEKTLLTKSPSASSKASKLKLEADVKNKATDAKNKASLADKSQTLTQAGTFLVQGASTLLAGAALLAAGKNATPAKSALAATLLFSQIKPADTLPIPQTPAITPKPKALDTDMDACEHHSLDTLDKINEKSKCQLEQANDRVSLPKNQSLLAEISTAVLEEFINQLTLVAPAIKVGKAMVSLADKGAGEHTREGHELIKSVLGLAVHDASHQEIYDLCGLPEMLNPVNQGIEMAQMLKDDIKALIQDAHMTEQMQHIFKFEYLRHFRETMPRTQWQAFTRGFNAFWNGGPTENAILVQAIKDVEAGRSLSSWSPTKIHALSLSAHLWATGVAILLPEKIALDSLVALGKAVLHSRATFCDYVRTAASVGMAVMARQHGARQGSANRDGVIQDGAMQKGVYEEQLAEQGAPDTAARPKLGRIHSVEQIRENARVHGENIKLDLEKKLFDSLHEVDKALLKIGEDINTKAQSQAFNLVKTEVINGEMFVEITGTHAGRYVVEDVGLGKYVLKSEDFFYPGLFELGPDGFLQQLIEDENAYYKAHQKKLIASFPHEQQDFIKSQIKTIKDVVKSHGQEINPEFEGTPLTLHQSLQAAGLTMGSGLTIEAPLTQGIRKVNYLYSVPTVMLGDIECVVDAQMTNRPGLLSSKTLVLPVETWQHRIANKLGVNRYRLRLAKEVLNTNDILNIECRYGICKPIKRITIDKARLLSSIGYRSFESDVITNFPLDVREVLKGRLKQLAELGASYDYSAVTRASNTPLLLKKALKANGFKTGALVTAFTRELDKKNRILVPQYQHGVVVFLTEHGKESPYVLDAGVSNYDRQADPRFSFLPLASWREKLARNWSKRPENIRLGYDLFVKNHQEMVLKYADTTSKKPEWLAGFVAHDGQLFEVVEEGGGQYRLKYPDGELTEAYYLKSEKDNLLYLDPEQGVKQDLNALSLINQFDDLFIQASGQSEFNPSQLVNLKSLFGKIKQLSENEQAQFNEVYREYREMSSESVNQQLKTLYEGAFKSNEVLQSAAELAPSFLEYVKALLAQKAYTPENAKALRLEMKTFNLLRFDEKITVGKAIKSILSQANTHELQLVRQGFESDMNYYFSAFKHIDYEGNMKALPRSFSFLSDEKTAALLETKNAGLYESEDLSKSTHSLKFNDKWLKTDKYSQYLASFLKSETQHSRYASKALFNMRKLNEPY